MLDEVITTRNVMFDEQLFYTLEDEDDSLSVRECADIILEITEEELLELISVSEALGIPDGIERQALDLPQLLIEPLDVQLKGSGVEDELLGGLLIFEEIFELLL